MWKNILGSIQRARKRLQEWEDETYCYGCKKVSPDTVCLYCEVA